MCIINFIDLDIFHFIESHVNYRLDALYFNQLKPTLSFSPS